MIAPCCIFCDEELDEPGAILLGPPNSQDRVKKEHLCVNCNRLLHTIISDVKRKRNST